MPALPGEAHHCHGAPATISMSGIGFNRSSITTIMLVPMRMTQLFVLAAALLASAAATSMAAPVEMSAEYSAALRSGNAAKLRQALQQGASPNARDTLGNT